MSCNWSLLFLKVVTASFSIENFFFELRILVIIHDSPKVVILLISSFVFPPNRDNTRRSWHTQWHDIVFPSVWENVAYTCMKRVTWPNHRLKSKMANNWYGIVTRRAPNYDSLFFMDDNINCIIWNLGASQWRAPFARIVGDTLSTLLECFIPLVEGYLVQNIFTIHCSQ